MISGRILTIGALALSLALGACSSNDAQVDRLETELEAERMAVDDLESRVRDAEAATEAERQKLEAERMAVADLESRVRDAEAATEAERQMLEAAQMTVADLETRIRDAEAATEADTQKLAAARMAVADLEARLRDAEAAAEAEREKLADLEARTAANAAREGPSIRHFYGLGRYLPTRAYTSMHVIEDEGSTLALSFNDPAREPIPNVERADDPPPDQGVWKAEKFTQERATPDGGTHYDVAIIYRTEPQDDSGYLYFGWWERGQSGGNSPRLEFFALPTGANGMEPVENISALTGTATYAGIATGKYGILNPLGGTNTSGSFTATATLTADFATSTDAGSVSGMIDGFVASGQPQDWTVELKEAPISATVNGFRNLDRGSTQWRIAGERAPSSLAPGWWGGNFRSADAITGAFNASYWNVGRMTGSFGALKE